MNKFYPRSAAVIFAGISSPVLAAPDFYIGGQAGYQATAMQLTETNNHSDNFSSKAINDYDISGVTRGLLIGAKIPFSSGYFLSLEGNIGASGADGKDSYSDSDGDKWVNELEAGETYGIGILAGFEVGPRTSLYGRLGYQKTNYELSYKSSGSYFGNLSGTEGEDFSGIRFGLGMESEISHQFAVRLDWSQTKYSSEDLIVDGTATEFEPTENAFQVGLLFKF